MLRPHTAVGADEPRRHEVDARQGDARLDSLDRRLRVSPSTGSTGRLKVGTTTDDDRRLRRPPVRHDVHARRRRVRQGAEPLRRLVPRRRDRALRDDHASAADRHDVPSAPPNLHTTSVTQTVRRSRVGLEHSDEWHVPATRSSATARRSVRAPASTAATRTRGTTAAARAARATSTRSRASTRTATSEQSPR